MTPSHRRCPLCVFPAVALTIAFTWLTACRPPGEEPADPPDGRAEKGLVGRVADSEAIIGLVIEGEHVIAYVCDGVEGSESIAGWYEGALLDGAFELIPISGTSYEGCRSSGSLTGMLTDGGAAGTYDAGDGVNRAWSASAARDDRAAGLYLLSDGKDLVSVAVDNDDLLRGLSRDRTTGWTTKVVSTGTLQPATTQDTQVFFADAPVSRQVSLVTRPTDIIRVIAPAPDPGPVTGVGTLMIHAVVSDERVIGHRSILARPDELGVPTLDLTRQLLSDKKPAKVFGALMRVVVLDELGKIVSTHFIDDPLDGGIEVPGDPKSGEGAFWTRSDVPVSSFLVAVPNIKGARTVTFTRYTDGDVPLKAGAVDLNSKALERPLSKATRAAQSATNYDAADAEFDTVVNNGPPENRMDLLILAEGFIDSNFDREQFRNLKVPALLEYLWTIPIYNELRSSINVHVAYVPSRESGSGNGPTTFKDTPYQTYFNHNGLERLLWLTNAGEWFTYEVAAQAPAGNYGSGSVDAIGILVNDTRYGGAGGSVLTASINAQAPEIFSHEFGHRVVGLADEYEDPYNDTAVELARLKPNCSGSVSIPSELKWFDLVAASTPIPTELDPGSCTTDGSCRVSDLPPGTVGMYEGAGYTACGSFRPTTQCQMRCYPYPGYFCPVCRRAYQQTFAPYLPGAVDVFIRDNILDYGDPPSPVGVDPGTGLRVWSWESPDLLLDAPPFHGGDLSQPHEAPIPGQTSRVYVTVTNRGIGPDPANAIVDLWYAHGAVGSPPFPGPNWTPIGTQNTSVAPFFGKSFLVYEWNVPPSLDPNVQLLALVRAPGDDLVPASLAGQNLNDAVRNNNNVARRNQYPITLPVLSGEITNHEKEVQPIVLRFSFPQAPLGTTFTLSYENTVAWSVFEPSVPLAFPVIAFGPAKVDFQCTAAGQQYLQLRGNLPAGAEEAPYINRFMLEVGVPSGAPLHGTYTLTFTQFGVNEATGLLGDVLGGSGYMIIFN